MTQHSLGIIMNGVTGRMGMNQHLIRSIVAIRAQGGVTLRDGDRVMPDPILVGRNAEKVAALAKAHGIERWTTDLDAALADQNDRSSSTPRPRRCARRCSRRRSRPASTSIARSRSPTNLEEALEVPRPRRPASRTASCRTSCSCPGLQKLKMLRDSGFFGRMLSVRGEFGYWVFEGDWQPAQRPSWNYRRRTAAASSSTCSATGATCSTTCSARCAVSCLGATHIPERVDEKGRPYKATADDAAYATFELDGGVIAHINTSWCVRVYRDDLVTFQVDGTHGSAVAGLTDC